MFDSLKHYISHILGTNTGRLATWGENDRIYLGFECDYCKKIDQNTVVNIESEYINGKRDVDFDSE